MNKLQYWILAAIIASPTFLMAQTPAEELSPTAPEFNIEVMDAPVDVEPQAAPPAEPTTVPTIAPTLQTIAPTIAPIQMPVVEAKPAEAAKVEEDKSIKGITLAPAIVVKPIGFNGERDLWYFELNPTVGLESVFKTANNRDVSLGAEYGFIWDESITKRDVSLRYFEHDLSGSATIDWTKTFSTKINGGFNYSLWASESREFAIFSDDSLQGIFKINDQVSVTTGYRIFYFNDLDSEFRLSDGNYPGDPDDVRQGNAGIGGSNSFEPSGFDPSVGNTWFANNGLQLQTSFKPMKGTKLGLQYEYVFSTFTNTDATVWHGHWITASISQTLPWKGGSISLKDQLRLRNYQSKTNDDGSLVSNLRNRVTLTVGQEITSSISTELFYRWEMSGSNKDNYAELTNTHFVNLGFKFGF